MWWKCFLRALRETRQLWKFLLFKPEERQTGGTRRLLLLFPVLTPACLCRPLKVKTNKQPTNNLWLRPRDWVSCYTLNDRVKIMFLLLSGKLNSSLNRSVSGSSGPAPRSVSKPANPRPTRSSVYGTAAPASTTAGRRSLSTQVRRPSEVEQSKTAKSTPLKKTTATPLQMTPSKRVLERSASVPANATTRLQSGLKTKPKPEAMVLPTPSGGVRGPPHKDGQSRSSFSDTDQNFRRHGHVIAKDS